MFLDRLCILHLLFFRYLAGFMKNLFEQTSLKSRFQRGSTPSPIRFSFRTSFTDCSLELLITNFRHLKIFERSALRSRFLSLFFLALHRNHLLEHRHCLLLWILDRHLVRYLAEVRLSCEQALPLHHQVLIAHLGLILAQCGHVLVLRALILNELIQLGSLQRLVQCVTNLIEDERWLSLI